MAKRKHVLVVESDPLVAAAIGQMLDSSGFRATLAPDGPSARAILTRRKRTIDAVVLAVVIHGGDGVSLAAEIGALNLPLVMMSGYDDAMNMAADLGLQLLHKPFRALALAEAVHEALASGLPGWRPAASSAPEPAAAASGGEDTGAEPAEAGAARIRQLRQKAEELRTVADQTTQPTAQATFRRMAATYDAQADRLEGKGKRERDAGVG